MTSVQLSSPDCWLDCLATLPDCDLSDLCSEVVLVGREGDTTVIPTVVMLATSQLFRQLKLHEPGELRRREGGCYILVLLGELLIFPEVATVHLEQVVHLLTSGTSERPGELREVGRDLQQVQHVMNLLVTGIDVSLANTTSDRARSVEEINNNASVDPVTPKSHTKNNKYSRRELKRLISTPHKAGRPGVYCKVCMKSVSNSNTLRTHIKLKHPEATFACKICNQKFIYEVNLKKHVESKHSEGSRDVVTQTKGKSTCPQCYKLIGNKVWLPSTWFNII